MDTDTVAFTRQLVDIESITGNEGTVSRLLYQRRIAPAGFQAAEDSRRKGERCNVFTLLPPNIRALLLFSPLIWIPSAFHSRRPKMLCASTDVAPAMPKGIIASPGGSRRRRLRKEGIHVGRFTACRAKRGTAWAPRVAKPESGPGCKFLVNGEPTREPGRRRVQRSAARGDRRRRTHGALGLSGVGGVGD